MCGLRRNLLQVLGGERRVKQTEIWVYEKMAVSRGNHSSSEEGVR